MTMIDIEFYHVVFTFGFAGGVIVGMLLMIWIYHKFNIVKYEE